MAARLSAALIGGVLRIEGTESADSVSVRESAGILRINNGTVAIKVNGANQGSLSVSSVSRIKVFGLGGNDQLDLGLDDPAAATVPAELYGGLGNDTLRGGKKNDVLYGDDPWLPDGGWRSQRTGDFDGDGKDDIANFNQEDGTWWIGISTGTSFAVSRWADFDTNSGWTSQILGDFNADGKDDIANFHPGDGTWWVAQSTGTSFAVQQWADFETNSGWTNQVVGDFNADGRADIANFHPSDGTWWVARSTGSSFVVSLWADFETNSGWTSQIVGDFNGDGRDDIANFHPSDGTWWVAQSTGQYFNVGLWNDFDTNSGWTSQIVGDFDADGKDDIANFYPGDGTWWVARSTGQYFNVGLWNDFDTNSGWSSQIAGDFNGDGRDDVANFHPSDGTWWVAQSAGGWFNVYLWDNFDTNSGWTSQIVGDYDGDGRDDVANFYPGDGTWWVARSMGQQFQTTQWANFGRANSGADSLYGGAGNDWLEAGSAVEVAEGGTGDNWNAHRWAINGTTTLDVQQTGAGTCVFLSTLAGATRAGDLGGRIRYLGNYSFQVDLFDPSLGRWVSQTVAFDGSIVTNSSNVRMDPFSIESANGAKEFWTILYQRAYLQRFVGINPLDGNAVGNFGGESTAVRATKAILGKSATSSITATPQSLRSLVLAGKTVAVAVTSGPTSGHSYWVKDVYQDATGAWRVRLFNPWHKDAVAGEVMPFDTDGAPNEGIITVRWADLAAEMNNYTTSA